MLVKIMQLYIPGFIKKKMLKELFRLTADAFQSGLPELKGLSFSKCLFQYAQYTREQAESCLKCGYPFEAVKSRLYQNSFMLGRKLRKYLLIKKWTKAVSVLKAIYKHIGIDFYYFGQGEVMIKRCYFSNYYSSDVCMLVSSLDEGLAAGLSDGGKLSFRQRITEGCSFCKGSFCGGDMK